MQSYNTWKTGAVLLSRPVVTVNHRSKRGSMRWHNKKSLAIGAVSFVTGCILTLLLCSLNDSALERTRDSQMKRQVGQNVRDENLPQDTVKSDGIANNDGAITDQVPETAIQATEPTLPPYPPQLKGKAMFLSPSGYDEHAFLFIIVVTSGRNFEARKSIRSSWGKSVAKSNSTRESFQVIFVVGCDEVNDERVEKEARTYGDILRGTFLDNYVQNELHTVKTLLGLKWAISMCNSAYILKVNPESFVNVRGTIEWLQTLSDVSGPVVKPIEGLYTGYCHTGVKVVRNPQSLYFVPENQWPDTFLPDYSSGVGVVLSRDVAAKMLQIAQQMTMIHIDDVFLGVMAKHLQVQCADQSFRFDIAYTTMLMECEEMHFCILGGVPAKDMFYLSQNLDNLRDICSPQTAKPDAPADLFYV